MCGLELIRDMKARAAGGWAGVLPLRLWRRKPEEREGIGMARG